MYFIANSVQVRAIAVEAFCIHYRLAEDVNVKKKKNCLHLGLYGYTTIHELSILQAFTTIESHLSSPAEPPANDAMRRFSAPRPFVSPCSYFTLLRCFRHQHHSGRPSRALYCSLNNGLGVGDDQRNHHPAIHLTNGIAAEVIN
ncbi:hypothetical protein EVAR_102281_1 [Eumeta japonica]|uniref:Uncharacterized protein n=1 Tax=Eumeta variegata TaxID=151549 RepID=A0A4C1WIH6_EUMVA|nr:hypothetical protein EVAR_102281_1 [Eumeta japonica]